MSKRNRGRSKGLYRASPPLQAKPQADSGGGPENVTQGEDSDQNIAEASLVQKLEREVGPMIGGNPAKREAVIERVVDVVAAEVYKGPLPHPRHFAGFEAVCPGAADRILTMAETARSRADDRYDTIVSNDHVYSMRGLNLAAIILALFVGAGTVLVLAGHEAIGTGLLALSGLSVIASKFIDGRSAQRRSPQVDQSARLETKK